MNPLNQVSGIQNVTEAAFVELGIQIFKNSKRFKPKTQFMNNSQDRNI